MARVVFEFDKDFDTNVYHASNKTRSSLSPLYNQVRRTTDNIAKEAKDAIEKQWKYAEAEKEGTKHLKFDKNHNNPYLYAKAKEFALRSAYNTIRPTMGVDKEIYGRVSINRTGSTALEYGGIDVKAEMGRGTGNYLVHPVYAFLRNAMRRAAE